jgi:multidrug efflux system membrane fusion protein
MNEVPRAPEPLPPVVSTPALTPPMTQRRRRWPRVLLMLLVLAGGAAGLAWWMGWPPFARVSQSAAPAGGFGPSGGPRGRGAPPVPVSAVAAATRDLPIFLDALGTVQASNTITIVPQVSGRLIEVAFREGQDVQAGDVLVRLDPRSYQATLDQAIATRAQRVAQLANARLDLTRYTQLVRNNGASQQTLDTQRATVAQLEAQLQYDEATIAQAQVQLDYTTIRSPIQGRVGLRQVDVGNFVQTSSTGIVVVTQVRPIAVNFTLPQQTLPQVTEAIAAGPVPVSIRLGESAMPRPDGAAPPADPTGTLVTVDNQVDQATGTIRLKALFPNEDQRLWPGAFVNVRMQVTTLRGATIIPLVAVQRGPDGAFVFVVQQDNTVEQRPIVLGVMQGTDAVAMRGLRPGEAVVTSGALRLAQGSAVQVAEAVQPPPRPAGAGGGGRRRQGGANAPEGGNRPAATPPAGTPGQTAPSAPSTQTPAGGSPAQPPASATPTQAPGAAAPAQTPTGGAPAQASAAATPAQAPAAGAARP